jgi:hypothetical protein
MAIDDDDELARLRRRAYAPDADIATDPAALARLAELERHDPDTTSAAGADIDPAPSDPGNPPTNETEAAGGEASDRTPRRRFLQARLSRSGVVLVAVGAMVVVCSAVALTLVQRVQTHPLQPDAVQVARVSPDASFDVPDFFSGGPSEQAVGFTETHGFRVIVTPPGGASGEGEYCMTVFQPALVDAQGAGSWSYGGQYIAPACSAGTFPAAATVRLLPGSPELEHTDFPADTALQFIYDQVADEVVLFRG